MPKLVGLFLRGAALGFAIAVIAVIGLLLAPETRLAHLIFRVDGGMIALGMLTFMMCLTFGGAQIAFYVLMLNDKEE
ncbi:MAG: hypothetical protein MRY74_08490 [Neomegalonema sp.]|nr:hypothetical protein [Neomegalonema sp.]